jgi:phosphate transport system substrate-binding protein
VPRLGRLLLGTLLAAVAALGHAAPLPAAVGSRTKLPATTLEGEGSTFQLHYTQAVITAFRRLQPAVRITYEGLGSPRGLDDLANRRIDFAGTDRVDLAPAPASPGGGPLLYFPLAVSPIVVAYNLPGIRDLRLSANTIAEIFEGEISTWNAPEIRADNPDRTLPDLRLVVAHRSDGSGTTKNFTTFLTEAAPAVWTRGTGATVQWPVDSHGAAGNYGVAQIVKTTEGAVGYVDFPDAEALALTSASVENAAGVFVTPSVESASAALVGIPVSPDLSFDPINASGKDAYPITAPTWLVVFGDQPDARKAAALKAWLRFVYSAGQPLLGTADFTALPNEVLRLARAQISAIVVAPL